MSWIPANLKMTPKLWEFWGDTFARFALFVGIGELGYLYAPDGFIDVSEGHILLHNQGERTSFAPEERKVLYFNGSRWINSRIPQRRDMRLI